MKESFNPNHNSGTVTFIAGRAGGIDRVAKVGNPSRPDAVQLAEAQGASLITGQWLCAFGMPQCDWVSADFERRLRSLVRNIISTGAVASDPRPYSVGLHLQTRSTMEVDWRNRFQMRFRGDYACWKDQDGNKVHFSVAPFAQDLAVRRPVHCSHFRFFLAVGAMCDFAYSRESSCYMPLRPDLLGHSAVEYSAMFAGDKMSNGAVDLVAGLPAGMAVGSNAELVAGFGIEFWNFAKSTPDGRPVGRVMVVG